jgi:uncharacterized protein (TIGR02444 family)
MSGLSKGGEPRAKRSPAVEQGQSQFWAFSVSVYGASGVPEECLQLQDRYGVDVNLLLFCAYVGAVHGALLPDRDVRAAAATINDWNKNIVSSLREARRALKPFAADSSAASAPAATLRTTVKAAELEAERLEQMMLATWSVSRVGTWPRAKAEAAVAANVAALLSTYGIPIDQPGPTTHLVAAAHAAARSTRT